MHHAGHVALLAVAGAAGTLLRAGGTMLADRLVGHAIPWGTLAMNVAGAAARLVVTRRLWAEPPD